MHKPWGIPDETGSSEILYENIPNIKPLPVEFPKTRIPVTRDIQKVKIPNLERAIAFVFDRYSEKSAGPSEEELVGIYLA